MADLGKTVLVALMQVLLRSSVLFALILGWPQPVHAKDYLCNRNGITYWIQVDYEVPGQALPCSVSRWVLYQEPELLWRATKDPDFCQAKAEEIRQRLLSYGWLCQPIDRSTDDAPPAGTDTGVVGEPVM
jgi:hypothetical protein